MKHPFMGRRKLVIALCVTSLAIASLTGCTSSSGGTENEIKNGSEQSGSSATAQAGQENGQENSQGNNQENSQGNNQENSQGTGLESDQGTTAQAGQENSKQTTDAETHDGYVVVDTTGALLDAIAPDAKIFVDVSSLNMNLWLKDMKKQGEDTIREWNRNHPYVVIPMDDWDQTIRIQELDGLVIEGRDTLTELAVESGTSYVFQMENCKNITLRNLSLGHLKSHGDCEAEVLCMDDCKNIFMENVDLYGCGASGFYARKVMNLQLSNSVIRGCSDSLLWADNCMDVVLNQCELKDTTGYSLLWLSGSEVEFNQCKFNNNKTNGSYMSYVNKDRVRFNACEFGASDCSYLDYERQAYPELFVDCKFAAEPENVIEITKNQVVVSSLEDLFSQIADNTEITLQKGTYSVSEWLDSMGEAKIDEWNDQHEKVQISSVYDGYEVFLQNVENLSIKGETGDCKDTTILTDPRYAQVLSVFDSNGFSIEGITMGHTQLGECAGDVLAFYNTDNVDVIGMDLFGCGVTGLTVSTVNSLYVKDTTIHDCSESDISLSGYSTNLVFENCKFVNSPSIGYMEGDYSVSVVFDQCTFGRKESTIQSLARSNKWITISDCKYE